MTPRKRNRQNRDMPDNLYFTTRKDGRRYYYYEHPETGKTTGFGYDKKEAIAAANQLNQILGRGRNLVAKVVGSGPRLSQFLTRYSEEILLERRTGGHPLSEHTLAEYLRITRSINEALGNKVFKAITQAELADYLNDQSTAETYNKHRARLVDIYKHAVSEGIVPDNIAAKILPKDPEPIKRRRLSLEGYRTIYRHAELPIQNAMELALNLMQRRADIRALRFSDEKDGYLYVAQQKTFKRTHTAFIAIPTTLPLVHSEHKLITLAELIKACRSSVACPFLVHALPKRKRPNASKAHWAQLSREQISKGFAAARDASDFYADLPPAERPTFHEIISLGEHLRRKSGWPISAIQQLRGHTTEKMTRHYLEGHEWVRFEVPRARISD